MNGEVSEDILRLGSLLTSHPTGVPKFEAEALYLGLEKERDRLGKRPFLVMVYQNIYDIDGLKDYVFLMQSFDEESEAESYAANLRQSLLERQFQLNVTTSLFWTMESTGVMPTLPITESVTSLNALSDRIYKLTATQYDKKYTCIRVVGIFDDYIVGEPFFEFVNAREELWSYFVDIGQMHQGRATCHNPI